VSIMLPCLQAEIWTQGFPHKKHSRDIHFYIFYSTLFKMTLTYVVEEVWLYK